MKRLLYFIALATISISSILSCQQEPAEIRVASISLPESTWELKVGDQVCFDVIISPDNATNKKISWSSSNESVATVTPEGIIEAVSGGTSIITATSEDQGKTASCTVTVPEKMVAVTGEATYVSCRNARISGNVTPHQTRSPYFSFGVLYSTSSEILLENATWQKATEADADNYFTVDSGVLEPETTYYYKSYVSDDYGMSYGQTKYFKTLPLSSMIQTLDAGDVVFKEATLNAMLDLTDCKYNSIEYGFELTPEGGRARTLTANNLADKAFSYRDNNLSRNTGYSYAAYVKLDGILYKAVPKTFTTASIQASVTAAASDIQYHSATISGSLAVQSEGSFSKSAVLYYSLSESTLEGLKSNGNRKTLTLGEYGSYSETLSSLSSSTSYNFIVVAEVDDVELVTEVKSFKTLNIQASVTAEASDIKCNSATISGNLSVQSEGSFRKSAVLYYSSSESTLKGLKSKGTRKTLTLSADGSYSETLSPVSSSTSYNFVVVAKVDDVEFASSIGNFLTPALPSEPLVDLGLSVKWASSNLGASKPTEYGGYYQWAGTKDVSDTGIYLDWSKCPCHFGSDKKTGWRKYNTVESYGIVDNITVLEPKNDAATVALGGKWRMPTDDEWEELLNTDNTSWTWTTIDGVNGYKVQSKKFGYTDNWIFLPAASYRKGGNLEFVGSDGSYWSSSLRSEAPHSAYCLLFYSDYFFCSYSDRYYGQSVRPVSE